LRIEAGSRSKQIGCVRIAEAVADDPHLSERCFRAIADLGNVIVRASVTKW